MMQDLKLSITYTYNADKSLHVVMRKCVLRRVYKNIWIHRRKHNPNACSRLEPPQLRIVGVLRVQGYRLKRRPLDIGSTPSDNPPYHEGTLYSPIETKKKSLHVLTKCACPERRPQWFKASGKAESSLTYLYASSTPQQSCHTTLLTANLVK
jgi:hypothetical protein